MAIVNRRNKQIVNELRLRCETFGQIKSQRKSRAMASNPNDPDKTLYGMFAIGKEIEEENRPRVSYKSVEPGKRFKKEDATLVTLLGLLLGNFSYRLLDGAREHQISALKSWC